MTLQVERGLSRVFYARPWLIIRFCLWLYCYLLTMSTFFYGAAYVLRLDPFLAPLLQEKTLACCCVLFPLIAILMIPCLWVSYRRLVVILDETKGIEVRNGHRRRQIPWGEVTSYKSRVSNCRPSYLFLLNNEDCGLFATPMLVIQPFVDCVAIGRSLQDMGISRERRRRYIAFWNYRERWENPGVNPGQTTN
jgi:hypothetical protein